MVREVTAAELREKLDDGDVQVVDIRDAGAFRRGHIPGAENVPFHAFAAEIDQHDWGEEIVCVCPVGQSSKQAARLLESYEGIDTDETCVASLAGGYRDWAYDLESGDGR